VHRIVAIFGLSTLASMVHGQGIGPVQAPANLMPNFYNRSTQPLSPYLNMFRGASPGVDYYYGVRPGLPAGGQMGPTRMNPYFASPGSPFSFQYTPLPIDAGQGAPGQGYVLPPAGHANVYGNYFGIAGSSLPGYGSGRGMTQPGIANTRPLPAPPSQGAGGSRRP
jgi:hypothetical protein